MICHISFKYEMKYDIIWDDRANTVNFSSTVTKHCATENSKRKKKMRSQLLAIKIFNKINR